MLCSSANEFQQNSNSIYSTNMDWFVIDSSCLHLTCLSFVTNSWNHLKYNYSIVQSALMTRQILHYHYGIFCGWVAEVPPCEPSLCSSKEWGNMAVFTSYTEKNSSEMPGGRWAVLEFTGSLKINKSPTVWYSKASFSGREVIEPHALLSLDPPPCSLLLSE